MSKLLSYFKTLLESFLSSKAEWIQEQSMPSEPQYFEIPEANQRHLYVAPANGYVVIYGDGSTFLDILGYSASNGNSTRFTCETETSTKKSGSIPIKKGSSFSIYYTGLITEFYFVQCGH